MALEPDVRVLVARGSARHPELASRLEKAAFLLLFRTVQPQLDGTWTVGSERDASKTYTVNLNANRAYCTCEDSLRRPGLECKHSLAAVLLSRALLGLEKHRVFDQDEPSAAVAEAERLVGRLPRAERED
jgi:hypothetical protein